MREGDAVRHSPRVAWRNRRKKVTASPPARKHQAPGSPNSMILSKLIRKYQASFPGLAYLPFLFTVRIIPSSFIRKPIVNTTSDKNLKNPNNNREGL
jgi:hypothetical protein